MFGGCQPGTLNVLGTALYSELASPEIPIVPSLEMLGSDVQVSPT